jgi:hypothetical protein
MKRTSIAAGVDPGPDGKFGTADDGVIQSTSLQGAISALSVGGLLVGSSNPYDQFGIVAHSTIDDVLVGGVALDVPWLFGNVSIVENII